MLSASLRRTAIVMVLALVPMCGFAQDVHWATGADGNWNVAANWTPAVVPTSTDRAIIDASGSYTVTVSDVRAVTDLVVGDGSLAFPVLTIASGGSLTPSGASAIQFGAQAIISLGGILILNGAGVTLGNGGLIVLQTDGGLNIANNAILTNNGNLTIDGDFSIADPSATGSIVNASTIEKLSGTGTATIVPSVSQSGSIAVILVDAGTLGFSNPQTVTGQVDLLGGSTVSCPSPLTIGSGAVLVGHGYVQSDLVNLGTIVPDAAFGLIVSGNYQQDPLGILVIEVGDLYTPSYLQVAGTATLAGSLYASATGYLPNVGDSVGAVFFGSSTGSFSSVISFLDPGYTFSAYYVAGSMGVTVVAVNSIPVAANGTSLAFTPGDSVSVSHQAALTPPDITLEAWVKLLDYPGSSTTWVVASSTTGSDGYELDIDNSDGQRISWTAGGSSISQYQTLPLGRWIHLAVTQTGTDAIIYIDDVAIATGTVGPLVDALQPFTFGSSALSDNSFLMDEVRVWRVVLDPSDLDSRSTTSVDPTEAMLPSLAVPATDLVAVWHLDQISAGVAIESANGFDGTIIGAPVQTGDMGVLSPNAAINADLGSPGHGFLGVYDIDGPTHAFTVLTPPTKGTVTIDDQSTGAYTYIVNPGQSGTDAFTYEVSDGTDVSYPAVVTVQLGIALPNVTVGWTKPSADFYEGLAMPIAIQLSAPAPVGGLDISLNITGGIATDPADFTLSANPVSVPAGATSVTVVVTPIDDAVLEPSDEDFTIDLIAGPGVDVDLARRTFTGLIVDHEPLSLTALVGGSPTGTSISVSIGQVIEFDLHDGVPVLGSNGAPTFVYSTSAPSGTFTFFTTDLVRADGDIPTPDGDSDPVQKAVVCALRPGVYTFTVGDGLGTTDYTVTASDLSPIVVTPPVLPGSTEENTAYSAIGANTPAGLANLLGVAGSYSDTQASAYVWDASSQGYVRLPSQPSGGLTPGEAVFLASRVDFALDFDGVPLPMFFEVSLHPGWNFITIPSLGDGATTFDTHAWNDLRVFDSTTNAELVSTERDAAIGINAFLWNPLAGAYASVTSFDAGKGYWIRDNLASDLHIVRFPTLSLGTLNGFAASHQSRLYHGETPVKTSAHRRQFAAGGPPLPPGGLHQHAASGNGCGVGSGAAGVVLLLAMAGFAALSRRRLDG